MGDNEISLTKVSKSFPGSGEVLRDVKIEIKTGDFVVLLGPSGCGKSTLLKLMAGLEAPTSGTINWKSEQRFNKGFVFQESHLMPWRTALENVELPLELTGVSPSDRSARATQALEKVGLGAAGHLFPSEMSGGMKMRASLARAMVAKPSLLLLDEPFAALDEQTRFRLAEDLRQLWLENPVTILFVTHSLHEACFLAERVLIFSQNKPGTIRDEVRIDLPKVRTAQLRTEGIFLEQLKKLYSAGAK